MSCLILLAVCHFRLPTHVHMQHHFNALSYASYACTSRDRNLHDPAGGLPVKAFTSSDSQSDSQASRCLNPRHYGDQWDGAGAIMVQFVIGLTSGSWNASPLYEESDDVLENWIYNILVGYYWILCDIMLLRKAHGKGITFHHHSIAPCTLANIFSNVGHAIARARYWPANSKFSGRHQREWPEECHYGRVKGKNTRGALL